MNDKQIKEEEIIILEGLEGPRLRPGMYIGDTEEKGKHHLLWEIIDNSIDEHMNINPETNCPWATTLNIIIDGERVLVRDNGRGIPCSFNERYKKNNLELLLTILHSGGKFNHVNYQFSGGLHGLGLGCCNALSSYLQVNVFKNKKKYSQEFSCGKVISEMTIVPSSHEQGTEIIFETDKSIISGEWNYDIIYKRLNEISCLNPELYINFKFNTLPNTVLYQRKLQDLIPKGIIDNIFFSFKEENYILDIEFNYSNDINSKIISFVNNIPTLDGGSHHQIILKALLSIIESNLTSNIKNKLELSDIKKGLNLIINLKLKNPIFSGQTKSRLGNSINIFNFKNIYNEMLKYFIANNIILKKIIEVIKFNIQERFNIENTRFKIKKDFQQFIDSASLPGNLTDCITNIFEEKEIFLVEGESAGGLAKQARDKYCQAVLSMRGKFLNASKNDQKSLLKNNDISILLAALGLKFGDKQIESLRYNKIIIAVDADPDGKHICNLFLSLFATHFPQMIINGHLYIANPPLFGIKKNINHKVIKYFHNEKDMEEYLNLDKTQNYIIQRFKGLGEMNYDQLQLTTMSKGKRRLLHIKLTEDELAYIQLEVEKIMGISVEYRKLMINEILGEKIIEYIQTE